MHTPDKRKLNRAFTFIELLIVVTIIAILAGVSVPIFNTVKESAASSSSKAKLKSLGDLLSAYQGDNNGKFPSIESNNVQIEALDNWVSELIVAANPDLDIEEIRRDPQTKIFVSPGLRWDTPTGGTYRQERIMNTYAATDTLVGYDLDDNPDPMKGRHISRIERRSDSIMLVESQQIGNSPECRPWISWEEASGDLSSGEKVAKIVDFRYKNRINALMADFSVRSYNEDEAALIREWNWAGEDYPDNYR